MPTVQAEATSNVFVIIIIVILLFYGCGIHIVL